MYKEHLTDDEKYMQGQLLLEVELKRLRREYGVLEKGRLCFKDTALLRSDRAIQIFRKEHEDILNNLRRAADPGKLRENEKTFDRVVQEVNEHGWMDGKIKRFKHYLEEMEMDLKLVKKSVHHLRNQQVTDKHYEDRFKVACQIVEALENKLEVQMRKFGTICAKNRELRTQIDYLLWDRRTFLKQWNFLIDKLSEGKHIMLDLIEQATIAYNQREEWCKKLEALRLMSYQELQNNRQMMIETRRKHDNNVKLEDFLLAKGQKRVMRDAEEKVMQKRMKQRQIMKEKVSEYRNMLADIKNFTKETDVEKISTKYILQDEENLSTFKYIVDSIQEIEVNSDNLGQLHLDIAELQALHEQRLIQQDKTLIELEQNLEDSRAEAECSEQRLTTVDAYYNKLLRGVDMLFKLCRCDKDPLMQLLGDNTNVQFYNVDLHLYLLESKVNEMLISAGYQDKISNEKKKGTVPYLTLSFDPKYSSKIFSIESIVPKTPCSLCVEREMVSDVIDTLQHVVDREEARRLLYKQLILPEGNARLHNISDCQLPSSRRIIQKRYQ